jgi:hypothetical protein
MIQLDNLSAKILETTYNQMAPQDFGNVFQDLVEVCLRHGNRPTLHAQGNAGNPDIVWNEWGWEVKSSQQITAEATQAAVDAMANYTNKRLVFLHTVVAPYTLYVANLEGFKGNQFNPQQLPQLPEEESELASSLGEIIRCMNSALYTEIPPQNVEQAMDPRRIEAVNILGW